MEAEPQHTLHLPPISKAAPGPLYRQIVEAIRREVSEGRIRPGDPLPSFRALAEQLLVSLITVKRAYEELEREGIIFRRQGLGTFISDEGAERSRQASAGRALELLEAALDEARQAGLSDAEWLRLARALVDAADGTQEEREHVAEFKRRGGRRND